MGTKAENKPEAKKYIEVRLDDLCLDDSVQPRVMVDAAVVEEYREWIERCGVNRTPLVHAVTDGTSWWVFDGFHRVLAMRSLKTPPEKVHVAYFQGTLWDARWRALTANHTHGLRRSTADKERAVRLALAHPQAQGLSDLQLALHVGVSDKTVAKYRSEMEGRSEIPNVETRRDTKGRVQPARKKKPATPASTPPSPPPADGPCYKGGQHEAGPDGACVKCFEPDVGVAAVPPPAADHVAVADAAVAVERSPAEAFMEDLERQCRSFTDANANTHSIIAARLESLADRVRTWMK